MNWIIPFVFSSPNQIVARRCGSVPEIIDDGVSGIIFDTIEEGVAAVKRVHQLDRSEVRQTFERRFTSEKMAENYLKVTKISKMPNTIKFYFEIVDLRENAWAKCIGFGNRTNLTAETGRQTDNNNDDVKWNGMMTVPYDAFTLVITIIHSLHPISFHFPLFPLPLYPFYKQTLQMSPSLLFCLRFIKSPRALLQIFPLNSTPDREDSSFGK